MGSCVSSHKRKHSDIELHKSMSSKSDHIIFSPVKPNNDLQIAGLGLKLQPDPSTNFPDLGMFFVLITCLFLNFLLVHYQVILCFSNSFCLFTGLEFWYISSSVSVLL